MSLLKRIFGSPGSDPRCELVPLYNQIVAKARALHWYEEGMVPDSIDGRFDMVAAILSIVLLRLEQSPDHAPHMAYLTEVFVDDMDGQLRESGIGDVIVGKHVGRIVGALGGRIGAFRDALATLEKLDDTIRRNIYRSDAADPGALRFVANTLLSLEASLAAQTAEAIVRGEASW